MKCTKCGFENTANARFCGKCGAPLAVEAPTPAAPRPAQPSVKRAPKAAEHRAPVTVVKSPRKKGWIPLVCTLVVVALVVGIFVALGSGGGKNANSGAQTVKLPERKDYLGTWYLNAEGGLSMYYSSDVFVSWKRDEMTLEIREDGTALVKDNLEYGSKRGEEEEFTCDWTLEGYILTLTSDPDHEDMTLTLRQDGTLVGRILAGRLAIFGREHVAAEVLRPFAPVAAESAEDFTGHWSFDSLGMMRPEDWTPGLESYYEGMTADIKGTTVTISQADLDSGSVTVEAELEDGKLEYRPSDKKEFKSFTAQLLADGRILMHLDILNYYILEKAEPAEAYQPAEPIAAKKAKAFAGTWAVVRLGKGGTYFPVSLPFDRGIVDIEGTTVTISYNKNTNYYNVDGSESFELEAQLEDGKLVYGDMNRDEEEYEEPRGFTAQLLEDGSLQLTLNFGSRTEDWILVKAK